jgi:FkbM family methyltransferase
MGKSFKDLISKHYNRTCRSLGRRWREWQLPRGYVRLGTRYGGWWLDAKCLGQNPLLVDAGLGEDISFSVAFTGRFAGARVCGIEPNPRSLTYCRTHRPEQMEILERALWVNSGDILTFHLPRPEELLPKGADGVSGSLLDSHDYVHGGEQMHVETIDFRSVLSHCGATGCDVLKLDIEGAEYELLKALCSSGDIKMAGQVLIEFHHGVTHHTLDETHAAVQMLGECGFKLIHTEGRNYIFRRENGQGHGRR